MRTPKVVSGGVSYGDLIVAGITKYVEERALAKTIVGNGTIKSGAIKLIGGLALRRFLPKGTISDGVSLGFAVDGVEDILTSFFGSASGASGSQGGSNW